MHDDKKLSSLTSEKTEFKREIGVFGGISIIGHMFFRERE